MRGRRKEEINIGKERKGEPWKWVLDILVIGT
jgi:hypothetical protein